MVTYLTYTAKEIDEKLKSIPFATDANDTDKIDELQEKWLKTIADQEYAPESEKAQSGKAVAQAIAAIKFPDATSVDQSYNASSENAQSGKAVDQAIKAALKDFEGGNTEITSITDEEITELFSEE